MKRFATILFAVTGAMAILSGAFLLLNFLISSEPAVVIRYSSKQIDVLIDTASALIPTVAGFAVLAASGAGYLHTHRLLRSQTLKLGVVSVFVALVASMAFFVYLLGAAVDCSLPFDCLPDTALTSEITADDACYLQFIYRSAVTSAQLACISFFFALDIALLIAFRVFSDGKEDSAGATEAKKVPADSRKILEDSGKTAQDESLKSG